MSNKNVTKIERLSSGMVKLYNKSNVIGAFSALNSISIGYENNNARTIQFTDNGNTISFQLFNLQEIIGSTTTVTYTPIDTTSTGPDYNARVFEVFDFLSSQVFQGFSPGPTYVGGVVAAYPNYASFPVTGTQSVIYIDEADNSAYYWDGSAYQLLVSTGVEQYANFASFPVTGSANVIYVDMSVPTPYVWNGTAYESIGSAAVWGGITGTLSAQTDLQAALDAKFDNPTGKSTDYLDGTGTPTPFPSLTGYVPYIGATGNVDLGEYELKAGQVELDQSPTGAAGVGVMRWNNTDGTADLGLKGGNVTLQLGQEMVIRAVNKSGGDLLEANYQAVRLRLVSEGGAAGQRLAVKLALADSDINSATTIGLVTETINNNQEGFITTIGVVREINTTGSLQGETWVDGDILYLSPTVAGQLTNIKPVAPDHLVVVGYVEYAHAIHGKIYVKCDNGYELDELHNVYINAPTTWQVLRYDATAGYWTNSSLTASILPSGIDASKIGAGTVDNTEFGYLNGVTSSIQTQLDGKVPTTRSITINGTTQDLSADRTFTISTNPGTVTSVAALTLGTTGTDLSSTVANGTSTPVITLNVPTASATNRGALSSTDWSTFNGKFTLPSLTSGSVLFSNGTTIAQSNSQLFWDNVNNRLGIGTASPANTLDVNGTLRFGTTGNLIVTSTTTEINIVRQGVTTFITSGSSGNAGVGTISNAAFTFFTNNGAKAQITAGGNFLIGTTTDAGYKLDVNGSGRILNGSAQLLVNNATYSELAYGTTNYFRANGASAIVNGPIIQFLRSGTEVARFATTTGNLLINTTTDVASSILTLASITKGFLPPRMTTTQKNAIATPAAGLVVYDTTLNKLCVYTTTWEVVTSI